MLTGNETSFRDTDRRFQHSFVRKQDLPPRERNFIKDIQVEKFLKNVVSH